MRVPGTERRICKIISRNPSAQDLSNAVIIALERGRLVSETLASCERSQSIAVGIQKEEIALEDLRLDGRGTPRVNVFAASKGTKNTIRVRVDRMGYLSAASSSTRLRLPH